MRIKQHQDIRPPATAAETEDMSHQAAHVHLCYFHMSGSCEAHKVALSPTSLKKTFRNFTLKVA